MSLINTSLKPFRAQAYHQGDFTEITDETTRGRWSIFFFYPADFTFVCPTELEVLASKYDELQKMGKVGFPLLGDPTATLAKNFDVYLEDQGIALRGTFLVDPEGKIKLYEVHDDGVGRNADELVRKVKAAQYVAEHPGEVCPAKWEEGQATLKPSLDLVGKL